MLGQKLGKEGVCFKHLRPTTVGQNRSCRTRCSQMFAMLRFFLQLHTQCSKYKHTLPVHDTNNMSFETQDILEDVALLQKRGNEYYTKKNKKAFRCYDAV